MLKYLGAAALLALSVGASAQTMTSATYVMKAGAGDLFERDSSRLVAASTANPQLKTFANEMVRDHTTSTAEVKAAAMKAHMHPGAPKLNAMQARDMAALRAAKGTARDQLYITQQKTAHEQALALQQGYAQNGTSAPLKMAAAKIVPVVEHHITMLQGM